ncbi:hypothetical protein GQR58_019663 [Nymphon striatum]|nr:hypothetical protein GQR58_019663 [Nymphon striatum]
MGRKCKSENVPKNDAKVKKISEFMCVSQSNCVTDDIVVDTEFRNELTEKQSETLSQRPKRTPNRKFRDESNSVTDDIVVDTEFRNELTEKQSETLSQRPKCTPNRKFRDESNSVTDDIVVDTMFRNELTEKQSETLSQRPKCTPNRKFRDESNSVTDDIVVDTEFRNELTEKQSETLSQRLKCTPIGNFVMTGNTIGLGTRTDSNGTVAVHHTCRKKFIDTRKSSSDYYSDGRKLRSSTYGTQETAGSFDWKSYCFLFSEKTDAKKNIRKPIKIVQTLPIRENLIQKAKYRNDDWGNQVLGRHVMILLLRKRYTMTAAKKKDLHCLHPVQKIEGDL